MIERAITRLNPGQKPIVGQPSQSNYAAANNFLDNLACQRNHMGLAATSVALPMVLGVGVVAENDALEDKITRRGMYGIDERDLLRTFEAAMSWRPRSDLKYQGASILLGLDPGRLAGTWTAARENTGLDWVEDGRFIGLKALVEAASGGKNGDDAKDGGEGVSRHRRLRLRKVMVLMQQWMWSLRASCRGVQVS
ncbi:hypothetical protein N7449_001309 [Penicillium cf. viridicatum]|uniref:Ketoreductase (KR) domain-containing protein n=1 Tax=Penicillium cf. viridicatum TaxID=2972119 RepID=A0A9W9N6K5_9EURO|nr:hypothetical protein N7449_001309 [Penicillium cf. viridicatum]